MDSHRNKDDKKFAQVVAAIGRFFEKGWQAAWSLPRTVSIFLIVLVLGIVAAAFIYYHFQEVWVIQERESDLAAVADLKVSQIVRWRLEREGDGLMITHNNAYARQAELFFEGKCPDREILQWVKVMCSHNDYSGAGLFDSTGNLRLSYGIFGKKGDSEDNDLIEEATMKREVVLSDLHLEEASNQPVADLAVPLLRGSSANLPVVGVYLFHIDPQSYLFPLVRSWPSESRSSETLLIRREGDQIVYLNELRHMRGSALRLRKPASSKVLPAAMAVTGGEGSVTGIDYRGVNVIASIKKVPGTSWFLLAKVDREEIDDSLRRLGWMDGLIGGLFILATFSIIGFWWRHQRVRILRTHLLAERERRALVQHFEYLVRFANDIIILADKDLKIVEVNNKAVEVYGYLREEFIGSNIAALEAAERAEQFSEQLRLLNLFLGATYESIHQKKDGTIFPVEVSARVITIEGTVYYQTISRDITERKKSEAELREREFWMKESQRVGRIGSYAFDFRKGVWTSSDVLDGIFGIGGEDDRSVNSWLDIVHPDEKDEMLRYFTNDVIAAAKPFDKEYRIVRRSDGAVRWVWGRGELSFDGTGLLTSMVGTIQDITDRKEAEAEIRSLNIQLEQRVRDRTSQLENANRELEAFSYSVSHDLRAPLRGIDGWSLALVEDYGPALDKKANDYVTRIRSEAQRMGALIDDLLQLSRVSRADISFARVDISTLVRTIGARLQEIQCGRTVEFNVQDGLMVEGDEHLLEIAITNLLDNACKFTGPCAKAKVEFGKKEVDGRCVYFVRDNGVGFDMAYAKKLFGPFQRMHKNSEFPGTGIGLATVQRIIRRHRGEIWAEAAVGNGATFFFTLQKAA